jgi:glucokinase
MGRILLAGDIGGTKTILRLVKAELSQLLTLYEQTYKSQDFSDLVPIVQQFFQEAKTSLNLTEINPQSACFGIAGPVINNTSKITNLNWPVLSSDRLAQELSIPQVNLINDFAAIGYGILGLLPEDLYTLQNLESDPTAPKAVLGAGTGLGECFLIPLSEGNYRVFSTEGAHADFAPRSELEFQLLNYIKEKNNLDRISIERVVSGQGIVSIYQFLREKYPNQESSKLAKIYQTWEQEKSLDLAAEI